MYRFREILLLIGCWHLTLFLTLANAQNNGGGGDFKHELPPGVELVNPKDLGLTDADLGKFLGNVKVLGGGQVGDTKTQILTVGFEGDENLNFDDFEIPGLTDKKATNLPEKDKEIANVAFEKFKEFFKDPKKNGKSYDEVTQRSLLSSSLSPTTHFTTQSQSNFQKQPRQEIQVQKQQKENVQYIQQGRPSPQTLQQHYPVTLTRPIVSSSTSRPPVVNQHLTSKPSQTVVQTSPQYVQVQQQQQQDRQQNHRTQYDNNNNKNNINYITPMIAAQQKLQSHVNQQINRLSSNANNPPSHLEFGAKLPSSQVPIQVQNPFNLNHVQPQQHQPQYNPKVQTTSQSPLPPGNFQRFNLYTPKKPQGRESDDSIGKVVRNQLSFNSNPQPQPQTPQPQIFHNTPSNNQQHYTKNNPSPSPSSSVPSPSIHFPQEHRQEERPVSHVFIHHQNHNSPVQQTSFHPRFQAPTKFVNNFTPSAPQITTPSPRFEVTPSMPMILLSTNENAITDPERTERLRQQQRHREELRLREEHRQREELRLREEQRQREEVRLIEDQQRRQREEAQRLAEEQKQQQLLQQQRQSHALNFQQQNHNQPQQQNFNNQQQNYNQQQQNFNHQNHPQQNQNQQQPLTQPPFHFTPNNPIQQNHQAPITQQPNRLFPHNQNNAPPPPQPHFNHNSINSDNGNYEQFQNQNSFNFQTQQQQHQLHTLQHQRPPNPPNNFYQQQQQQNQQPNYFTIQAQPSTNFPQQAGGFPPRFQNRPDPQQFAYSTIRHKRGYRNRLSYLIRGLFGEKD